MKLLVSGIVITVLLVAFIFVWIYLASQGQIPAIQAPLEAVSPVVRIIVLAALAVVIAVIYFAAYRPQKRGN